MRRYEAGYEENDYPEGSYERGERYAGYSQKSGGDRNDSRNTSPSYSRSDKHGDARDDYRGSRDATEERDSSSRASHRRDKYADDRHDDKKKSRGGYSPSNSEVSYRSSQRQRSSSGSPVPSRQSSRDKRAYSPSSPSRDEYSSRHSSPDSHSPRKSLKDHKSKGRDRDLPKSYQIDEDFKPSTSLMSEIQKTRPRKHSLKRESETDLTDLDKALQKRDLFGSPPLKRQAMEEDVEKSCREHDAEYRRKLAYDEAHQHHRRTAAAAGSHSLDYSGANVQDTRDYSRDPASRSSAGMPYDAVRTATGQYPPGHEPEIESKFSTPSPSTKSKGSESDKTPDSTERHSGSHSSGDISLLEREKQRLLNELQEMNSNSSVSDGEIQDEEAQKRKKPRIEDVFDDWSPSEAGMKQWREQAKTLNSESQQLQEQGWDNNRTLSKNSRTEPPPKPPELDSDSPPPADGDPSKFKPIDTKKSFRKQMEAMRKEQETANSADSRSDHRDGDSDMDTQEDYPKDTSYEESAGDRSPSGEFRKKGMAEPKGKGQRSYRTTCTDEMSFGSMTSGDEYELKPKRRISHYNKRGDAESDKLNTSRDTPKSIDDGERRSRKSESDHKSPVSSSRRESTDSKHDPDKSRKSSKDRHDDSSSSRKKDSHSRKDRSSDKKKSSRSEPPVIPKEPDSRDPPTDPRSSPDSREDSPPVELPLPKFADKILKKKHKSPSRSHSKRDSSTEGKTPSDKTPSDKTPSDKTPSDNKTTPSSSSRSARKATTDLDTSFSDDSLVTAAKPITKTDKRVSQHPLDTEESKFKELEIKEALMSEIKSEASTTDTSAAEACDTTKSTDSATVDKEIEKQPDTEVEQSTDEPVAVKEEPMDTTESEEKEASEAPEEVSIKQEVDSSNEVEHDKTVDSAEIKEDENMDSTAVSSKSEETASEEKKLDKTEDGVKDTATNANEESATSSNVESTKESNNASADSIKSDTDEPPKAVPKEEETKPTPAPVVEEKEESLSKTAETAATNSPLKVSTPRHKDASDSDTSDLDISGGLSIEERLRAIDEKLNQVATNEAKKRIGNSDTPPTPSTPTSTGLDYRDKYRVRKKEPPLGAAALQAENAAGGEQSDIARSLLSRSSIFDQDSKRLEQIDEKYQPKSYNLNSDRPAFAGGPEDDPRNRGYFTEPMTPNFAAPVMRSGQDVESAIGSSLTFAPPGSLANQQEKITPPPLSRHPFLNKKPSSLDSQLHMGASPTDVAPPLSAPAMGAPGIPRDPRLTPTSPTGLLLPRDPRGNASTSPTAGSFPLRDPRRDPISPPVVMPPSILKKSPITSPTTPQFPVRKQPELNAAAQASPPVISPAVGMRSDKASILKKTDSSGSLSSDTGKSPPASILKKPDFSQQISNNAENSSSASQQKSSQQQQHQNNSRGTGHTAKLSQHNEPESTAVPKNEYSSGDGIQYQSNPSPPVLTKEDHKGHVSAQGNGTVNALKRKFNSNSAATDFNNDDKAAPSPYSESSEPPKLSTECDVPMPATDGTMDDPPLPELTVECIPEVKLSSSSNKAAATTAKESHSPKSTNGSENNKKEPSTPKNKKTGKCSDEVTTPDSTKSQSPPSEPESKKPRLSEAARKGGSSDKKSSSSSSSNGSGGNKSSSNSNKSQSNGKSASSSTGSSKNSSSSAKTASHSSSSSSSNKHSSSGSFSSAKSSSHSNSGSKSSSSQKSSDHSQRKSSVSSGSHSSSSKSTASNKPAEKPSMGFNSLDKKPTDKSSSKSSSLDKPRGSSSSSSSVSSSKSSKDGVSKSGGHSDSRKDERINKSDPSKSSSKDKLDKSRDKSKDTNHKMDKAKVDKPRETFSSSGKIDKSRDPFSIKSEKARDHSHKEIKREKIIDNSVLIEQKPTDKKSSSHPTESKIKGSHNKYEKSEIKTEYKSRDISLSNSHDKKKAHSSSPEKNNKHDKENLNKDKSKSESTDKNKLHSQDKSKSSDIKLNSSSDKTKSSKHKDRNHSIEKPVSDTKSVERKHKTEEKPKWDKSTKSSSLDSKSSNNKKSHDKSRDEDRKSSKKENKKSLEKERSRSRKDDGERRSAEKNSKKSSKKSRRQRDRSSSMEVDDMKSPTRGGRRSEGGGGECGLETRELKMLRDALGPEAFLLEQQGFPSMYDSIKRRSCRRVSKDGPSESLSRSLNKVNFMKFLKKKNHLKKKSNISNGYKSR